ncbi:MAG: bifunctional DNA-formamidopyrimidine glycosylase/DNA-(apurinic or apyrimidinic site) lyase [Gammaproteobacteria bacterium]|nr:bifunctional DNA-formamidopyrimidine glycosylase/DNA-(apurinic or apyrimidinic site) lyase [Gammaproteobacteria bacterium]MDE0223897.1 bifunctional DNA-formamidopyrimidine glycosylase/DNA-(apurinic or apyrimidinic site) lyase [Gammaproteobacteria bacterium]
MPELPEVETTLRGIAPSLLNRRIVAFDIRDPRLRWPVELPAELRGERIVRLTRRAKYLLLHLDAGALILHLGMSGHLRIVSGNEPPGKHDHVDIILDHGLALRLTDPRRFGSLHWQLHPVEDHWLLRNLGIEPLAEAFTGDYLYARSRGRRLAVKNFLMDARIVVGIGNIYANEALFKSGVRPRTAAGRLSRPRYRKIAAATRETLSAAIDQGGTTLRDFVGSDGRPGYFANELFVYGRDGKPCRRCGSILKGLRVGQRSTVYCPSCQR